MAVRSYPVRGYISDNPGSHGSSDGDERTFRAFGRFKQSQHGRNMQITWWTSSETASFNWNAPNM